MAPKQTQNPTFHILDAAKTQPYVAALRTVRPELAAMAENDVRPAVDEVVAVLHAQLERVEAAKAVGGEPYARVSRLELLVLALARAQYELLWASPRKPVLNYDALVADAQRAFRFLDQLVTAHVRLGTLQWADLPRARRGQMTERCHHVLLLVETLRGNDIEAHDMRRAEALAHRVLASRPSIDSLTNEQLRDRAYTLLILAIEEEKRTCEAPERSGVFAITDLVGPYLADQAQLARCA